jgi:hypothetical protein
VKVAGRRGRLRLQLEPAEIELLTNLLDQLATLLDEADGDDDVMQRLNPAAYQDDPRAAGEFRALTEDGLRAQRDERIAACRADLSREGDIDLSAPEAGERWIQLLNDLRLSLGTRLGVTEDDNHDIDPTDPQAQSRLIYYWLTAVQDSVVRALMR